MIEVFFLLGEEKEKRKSRIKLAENLDDELTQKLLFFLKMLRMN